MTDIFERLDHDMEAAFWAEQGASGTITPPTTTNPPETRESGPNGDIDG